MSKMSVKQTTAKGFSGLVTVDSLTNLGINNPVKLDKFIQMQYRSHYGASMSDLLTMSGKKQVVSKDEDGLFRWRLQGATAQAIPIEDCLIDGTSAVAGDKIGIGVSRFQLVFSEKYFSDVDLIVGEGGSRKGQIRIVGEAVSSGTNWVHDCELITGDMGFYMDYSHFTPGKMFSKEYPLVEKTLSRKGGQFTYSTSYQLENSYSKIRFQETVPGNVFNRKNEAFSVWEINSIDENGKPFKFSLWDRYKEFEQKMQMKKAKEKLLMYSRSNRDAQGTVLNKGLSGFDLDQGAGLEEQLEGGNWMSYNYFDIDELMDAIYDLSDNTKGFDQKREVMVRTGKYGKKHAMDLIAAKVGGYGTIRTNDATVKGSDGGRTLSYNFTKMELADGATVSFYVDPSLDDDTDARNRIPMSAMTPGLPGPASSYTFQVLNVGSTGGEYNVEMIYVDGENDIFKVINGMQSPYQSLGGMAISSSIDGYSTHYMSREQMVIIRDATRCLTYIPQVLM